ncbi:hypothetical protein [Allokutzneria multivorans]|uniref:hypothetical protein n=1 Tax=Allokutzneria multivorans TaxID=1142134 RepID=UPI0031EDEA31
MRLHLEAVGATSGDRRGVGRGAPTRTPPLDEPGAIDARGVPGSLGGRSERQSGGSRGAGHAVHEPEARHGQATLLSKVDSVVSRELAPVDQQACGRRPQCDPPRTSNCAVAS